MSILCGVVIAEQIGCRYKNSKTIHWRQIIVFSELIMLLAVGFMPHSMDNVANAVISLSCAMQVQAFRKVNGYAYASTMCIGNMRSGMEAFSAFIRTKNVETFKKSCQYFGMIFTFAIGAGLGSLFADSFGIRSIFFSCAFLAVAFTLMFITDSSENTL